jgi:hypothetical protein
MGCRKLLRSSLVTIMFLYFVFLENASAYLDPGTGSYFFQLFVAAMLGCAFTIKLFWSRIRDSLKRFFSRKNRQKKDANQRPCA